MRDRKKTRRGLARHLLHQTAEAIDVGVVERRIDLVQHANGRGIRQEHGEDQRQRRQSLFAARKPDVVSFSRCPVSAFIRNEKNTPPSLRKMPER